MRKLFVLCAFVVLAACSKKDDNTVSNSTTTNISTPVIIGVNQITFDSVFAYGDPYQPEIYLGKTYLQYSNGLNLACKTGHILPEFKYFEIENIMPKSITNDTIACEVDLFFPADTGVFTIGYIPTSAYAQIDGSEADVTDSTFGAFMQVHVISLGNVGQLVTGTYQGYLTPYGGWIYKVHGQFSLIRQPDGTL